MVLKGYAESSAGTVRLRSVDPTEMPAVNFRYYDDRTTGASVDIAAIVESLRMVRRINGRVPGATEVTPGPEARSDAALEQFVRRNQWGHHASSTNAIGPKQDPFAVLDSRLRVRGTENVRVVDASSFPRTPGLYIWAPIAILSEKASQDILADAG